MFKDYAQEFEGTLDAFNDMKRHGEQFKILDFSIYDYVNVTSTFTI